MVLTAKMPTLICDIIGKLKNAFAIEDMGPLAYFLGVDVCRSTEGFFLSQAQYVDDILDRAGMKNCKAVPTPAAAKPKQSTTDGKPVSASDASFFRSIAGALQYLMLKWLDITYAMQQLCLHMHSPHDVHVTMMKRVMCYIKGMPRIGIQLQASASPALTIYSDAVWAGCPDTRRSTSGFRIFLGDALVS